VCTLRGNRIRDALGARQSSLVRAQRALLTIGPFYESFGDSGSQRDLELGSESSDENAAECDVFRNNGERAKGCAHFHVGSDLQAARAAPYCERATPPRLRVLGVVWAPATGGAGRLVGALARAAQRGRQDVRRRFLLGQPQASPSFPS
jgi:hypothetical protein